MSRTLQRGAKRRCAKRADKQAEATGCGRAASGCAVADQKACAAEERMPPQSPRHKTPEPAMLGAAPRTRRIPRNAIGGSAVSVVHIIDCKLYLPAILKPATPPHRQPIRALPFPSLRPHQGSD